MSRILSTAFADQKLKYRILGKGFPLLFLHGLGGNVTQAEILLGDLSGFRQISLQLRGHYESGADCGEITIDTLADDALALLNWLEVPRAVVVGVSLGDNVAVRMIRLQPERVVAAVLIAPEWGTTASAGDDELLGDARKVGPELALSKYISKLTSNDPLLPTIERPSGALFSGQYPERAIHALNSLLGSWLGIDRSTASRIKIPILLAVHEGAKRQAFPATLDLNEALDESELAVFTCLVDDDTYVLELQNLVAEFLVRHVRTASL